MGVKRMVDNSFWTDGKVDDFTPEDKYFMLYLLTNPFARQLGIYELSIKQAAFQMGYSVDAVKVLLDRFETKYHMIVWSESTHEVAILNYLRHSIVSGGKPVADCIKKDMKQVKNKKLIEIVFSGLENRSDLNTTVKKVVCEYLNFIRNDNDNDRAWHDSHDESLNESSKEAPKEETETDGDNQTETNIQLSTEAETEQAPSDPPKYRIPILGGEYPVYQQDIDNWAELYPNVDIEQSIRNIIGWCNSNPKRRKTARGVLRFINNWLAGDQDRGKCTRQGGSNGTVERRTESIWDVGLL